MPSDLIRLRGLEVFAHHGVLAEERQIGQRFVVDVDLSVDLAAAGKSDDLGQTVDYGALTERVQAVVAGERWNLIERVAQRVAEIAFEFDGVASVTVTVHKPEAPISADFADISVRITRHRDG
jgi:dihydroneopterin aldolase